MRVVKRLFVYKLIFLMYYLANFLIVCFEKKQTIKYVDASISNAYSDTRYFFSVKNTFVLR